MMDAAAVAGLFRLDGEVALVTGAGAGIGRCAAEVLAGAGAQVIAVDRDPALAQAAADHIVGIGGRCRAVAADVTDEAAVEAVFAAIAEEFGRLDVVVNNAGIYPPFPRLPEFDWATYQRTLDVNLHAVTRICVLAARAMTREGHTGGRIVNVSSIESLRPSAPSSSNYGISKAAVNGLTRAAAVDLGPLGVRVNAVLPGVVRTEGTSALPEEMIAMLGATIPAGRLGQPLDIAGAILFLASPASAWMTGHCLVVDGGATIAG